MGDYILDYFSAETIMIVAMRHGRQSETTIVSDETADFELPAQLLNKPL